MTQITAAEAHQLDYDLHTLYQGILPMWVITHKTKDFGDKYVARPHAVGVKTVTPLNKYLLADTLEEIREMLPPGLVCMPRQPEDDPVIVETWL